MKIEDPWWIEHKRLVLLCLFLVAVLLMAGQYYQIQLCFKDPYCSMDFWLLDIHKAPYTVGVWP